MTMDITKQPAVKQIPAGEQVLIRPDNENCR